MMGLYAPRGASMAERDAARYRTLKAAGSCVCCGAEAVSDRTRCSECARKNSIRVVRRRAERKAAQ